MFSIAWCFGSGYSNGSCWTKSDFLTSLLVPLLRSQYRIDLYSESAFDAPYGTVNDLENLTAASQHDLVVVQLEDETPCRPCFLLAEQFPRTLGIVHDLYLKPQENNATDTAAFHHCDALTLPVFLTERDLVQYSSYRDSAPSPAHHRYSGFRQDQLSSRLLCYPIQLDSSSLPLDISTLNNTGARIAFCGTTLLEHRAHKLLSALSFVARTNISPTLLWMLNESELEQAQELQREYNYSSVEYVIGRTPTAWGKLVASADVAVHTWFSAYGNPFPYCAISMATGVPCLVTDYSVFEFMPDAVVHKIAPGDSKEIEDLATGIVLLCKQQAGRELANSAKTFVTEQQLASKVADELNSCMRWALQ